MKIIEKIRQHIQSISSGEPFTTASLRHLGETDTVRKSLGRLTNAGEIERVARGVFVKPKKIANLGKIYPSSEEVINVIAKKTGETISLHGAEAVRKLHLSTQVPMQLVLYTSGKSRKIKIRERTVSLRHISPRKIVNPGSIENIVITALWYLGKNNVDAKTISKIEERLGYEKLKGVMKHMEAMPEWMASVLLKYNQSRKRAANEE